MQKREFPTTSIEVVDQLTERRWALVNLKTACGAEAICFLHEPPLNVVDKQPGYTYFPVPLNSRIEKMETSFSRNREPGVGPEFILTVTVFSEEEGQKLISLTVPAKIIA